MAGYSSVYVIGGLGGFQGADGVNPIALQILVGDADRRWLEAHYFRPELRPIGNVSVVIPERPDSPTALMDACIAFLPEHFAACPSLAAVITALGSATRIDFTNPASVPPQWPTLRSEAEQAFRNLNIWHATLLPVQLAGFRGL